MKKLWIAVLVTVTCMTSGFAEGNKIYPSLFSGLKVEYKNARSIALATGEGFTKATFVVNGEPIEAFYSPEGEMIGTSKAILVDKLSENAKNIFAKRFGGYTVKEAIRFDGMEESAYYMSADNEKETVIVKVDDADNVSIVSTTKK